MESQKQKILVIDDDLDVAEMLNAYFRVQGYEVFTVNRGEDGLRVSQTTRPDLVILDIRLPDIDGYEVARNLRKNPRTRDVPIIFLTERSDRADRLLGLELGADDFITKPFDVQELRLRVRNSLNRAGRDSLTNPVTGLPGGALVNERLKECLQSTNWRMLIITLENFDSFTEQYGFIASNDVLRSVGMLIQNALNDCGKGESFLGHVGTSSFALILDPDLLPAVEEHLQARLGQSLDYFYPISDRTEMITSGKRLAARIKKLSASEEKPVSLDQLISVITCH